MKNLIKIITILFVCLNLFFIFNPKAIFAGCCCKWYSCTQGCGGGMYTCSCPSPIPGTCCSGCFDYSCACPPPPCNNSCNGSCTLPSCPAGYTRTNPNNLCSSMTSGISCTYENDCKNTCTQRATCYKIETNTNNVAESQPTSLSMIIDGQSYILSSDDSTPTTVKYPSTENNVQTSIPKRTVPSTATGIGYAFRANNYGLKLPSGVFEWIAWTNCTNPRPEDYCSESTSNVQNFTPSSLTIPQVLKENAQGKIGGLYYTKNLCDAENLYSTKILDTYYKVDNEPDIVEPCPLDSSILLSDPRCVACQWDASILASDADCVINPPNPPECPWNEEILADDPQCIMPKCDIVEDPKCVFFPEVGKKDFVSAKGCSTDSYSGLEVNNPLKIRVGSIDIDSNNEIKGAVVWFSKDDTTPTLPKIEGSYTSTSTDDLGIMILQNNNSWNNTPLIYGITADERWAKLPGGTFKNSTGGNIARISDVTVTQGNEIITFEFDLELIANPTDNLGTYVPVPYKYKFKSTVLDQYMLLSDGRVDISHMQTYFNWGIDLVAPNMASLSQRVLGPQELYLNWNTDGTGSNITDAVINGYRDGALLPDNISLINPSGQNPITPSIIPPVSEIGLLADLNSWKFSSIGVTPYTSTDSTKVSIGLNEGGSIILYLTAFDQGCNDNLREHNIDLRPWVTTKGGVVYSQGSMGPQAKEFADDIDNSYYTINGKSTLVNFTYEQIFNELTTGTELIESRKDVINNILYGEELGAVSAINIYDSNDRKSYWFEYLKKKFNTQKPLLKEFTVVDISTSENCLANDCYMYSEGDIVIPAGYQCNRNTLFMSEGNITINPNIVEPEGNENTTGCIFVAKGDILIEEGNRISTDTVVGYDYIEGFLIAENQIIVNIADKNEIIRDGLEVKGGLVAIGNELSDNPSLLIQRNLRLRNYSNPTLVVNWDIKYARLSEIFFGTEAPMYKQEVGFKVF